MNEVATSRRSEAVKLRKGGLTYAEIGRRLGISRERVRQFIKPTPRKSTLNSKITLRIGEVAPLLGLHVNTVRRWSNRGILKAHRISPRGDRRFRREDIDDFLKRRRRSDCQI